MTEDSRMRKPNGNVYWASVAKSRYSLSQWL